MSAHKNIVEELDRGRLRKILTSDYAQGIFTHHPLLKNVFSYNKQGPAPHLKILNQEVPCSPCRGKRMVCYNNVCMKSITVEDVLAASEAILGSEKILQTV